MLIGALIGFIVALAMYICIYSYLQSKADEHNSNKLMVMVHGRAKVTTNTHGVVSMVALITAIGALIGHFC